MNAAAELGRIPVSKHQIQPEYGGEQANAGRDCRTRLLRLNSQAQTWTGKYSFSPFQLILCRIGNLTRLIHTLAICVTTHKWLFPVQLTTSRACNLIRLILTLAMCDDHTYSCWLKKNQNVPRPSEHPSVRGGKMSRRLGGIKGCK